MKIFDSNTNGLFAFGVAMDEEEAEWKVAEALKTIGALQRSASLILGVLTQSKESFRDPVAHWEWVRGFLLPYHISIKKSPEKKGLDELSGQEKVWRGEHWSCGDIECPLYRRHCSECGGHDTLYGDGHECECQLCGDRFTGCIHLCKEGQ